MTSMDDYDIIEIIKMTSINDYDIVETIKMTSREWLWHKYNT